MYGNLQTNLPSLFPDLQDYPDIGTYVGNPDAYFQPSSAAAAQLNVESKPLGGTAAARAGHAGAMMEDGIKGVLAESSHPGKRSKSQPSDSPLQNGQTHEGYESQIGYEQ